jgi:hypothetical protein
MNDLDAKIEQCKKDIEKLKTTLKELEDSRCYSIGQWFLYEGKDYSEFLHLVSTADGVVNLVLSDGTRWGINGLPVNNICKITKEEMKKLFNGPLEELIPVDVTLSSRPRNRS